VKPAETPPFGGSAESRARPVPLRSLLGGAIGNLVEWYDWYVYSSFSLYFSKTFFASGDRTEQLLNAAAIFAVGFLIRPLGGWLLGLYADRRGRRAALQASVLSMCLGSLVIAVTPGHARIGIAAPVLLVLARLLQGLSLGGEYGTGSAYLSEIAARGQRGFYASFYTVTLFLGQLLGQSVALLLQGVLSESELAAWGWRLPFALGALFGGVGLYLRTGIEETAAFRSGRRAPPQRSPLRELLRYPRELWIVFGVTLGGTVAIYTYSTFMQHFLVNTAGLSTRDATLATAGSLFVAIGLQPLVGALSDRLGRRPLLIAFGALGTLGTVPLLTALSQVRSAGPAFALVLAALAATSGYTAIHAVIKSELFPTQIRALGVGTSSAVAVSLFGGTADYVGLWFKRIGHEPLFYWYVSACIAVTLGVALCMREPSQHSRIDAGAEENLRSGAPRHE
jgi:MHS family alpha-ketoglutarate permease-like MFS transporter